MKTTVVLLGDSLTEAGIFPLTKGIPDLELHNLGIPGDTTWGILSRLHEIWDLDPTFVFLLVGVNDLANGEREEDIVVRHRRIWESVIAPDGPTLVLHPLLPVNPLRFPSGDWGLKNSVIYDLNFHLECEALKVKIPILDFRAQLIDDGGKLKDEYTIDGLHLTREAYVHWDSAISDFIKHRIT
ncbi:MAG: GDSL-type esterase/lipase family protein [Deltaproteobacteria bacterium]|nr:GDSL-type esterase/lipase family protein [Deltaproteobacteria bacterium]